MFQRNLKQNENNDVFEFFKRITDHKVLKLLTNILPVCHGLYKHRFVLCYTDLSCCLCDVVHSKHVIPINSCCNHSVSMPSGSYKTRIFLKFKRITQNHGRASI